MDRASRYLPIRTRRLQQSIHSMWLQSMPQFSDFYLENVEKHFMIILEVFGCKGSVLVLFRESFTQRESVITVCVGEKDL